jgi:hypothetical protein
MVGNDRRQFHVRAGSRGAEGQADKAKGGSDFFHGGVLVGSMFFGFFGFAIQLHVYSGAAFITAISR